MSQQNLTQWLIYKANFAQNLPEETIEEIKNGIDIITFFSSNTVKYFSGLVKVCHDKSIYATIGEETAKTTKEIFGRVDIIAEPFTEDGLIDSMKGYFRQKAVVINV